MAPTAALRGWTRRIALRTPRLRRLSARAAFRRLATLASGGGDILPEPRRVYSVPALARQDAPDPLGVAARAPVARVAATLTGCAALLGRAATSRECVGALRYLGVLTCANAGLGAAALLTWTIALGVPAPAPVLTNVPDRAVRAERMLLVAPPTVRTYWSGAAQAQAAPNIAPPWAVEMSAPKGPLPPAKALAQAPRVIEIAPAPLWSPYLAARAAEPKPAPQAVAALAAENLSENLSANRPANLPDPDPAEIETASTAPISSPVASGPAASGVDGPAVSALAPAAPQPSVAAPAPALPEIAIVVTAIGLNAAASEAALTRLSPEIALAVAPVAENAARWAAAAERLGRFTLVEIPLEPKDYPRLDPGALTLISNDDVTTNQARIDQSLALAPGVEGLSTYLGGRFLTDARGADMLAEAAKARELLLFENAPVDGSLLPGAAKEAGAPLLRSTVVLDNGGRSADIGVGLRKLERAAKRDGRAIGVAVAASEQTIEALRRWTGGLDQRGLRLVSLREMRAPRRQIEDVAGREGARDDENRRDRSAALSAVRGSDGAEPGDADLRRSADR